MPAESAAERAARGEGTGVSLVWLPVGTSVAELAAAGFAPGLMSAGLGAVPAAQTYLDVGQGNRVFGSLYDEPLPELRGDRGRWWREVVERAESAPAEIEPGLLARTVMEAGRGDAFDARAGRLGEVARPGPGGLVIAIARPRGESDDPVAIGVAGRGYDGNLTSESTRLDGYVLSTDVAPTVLDHLGVPFPAAMSGQPIRAEGEVDVAAIESLGERLAVISHRRGPVIGLSLLAWLGALLIAVLASRGAAGRAAVRLTALAVVYLPLVLLAAAALRPPEAAETLLATLGAPLLAGLTLLLLSGFRALAVAAGATVLAHAADVIAGSPLTSLSLLGPNPGLGARFYGIGNELEAVLAVLVVAGTGAALAGFWPTIARRPAAAAFSAVGLLAAVVFAAGRFGADVGAAIVFPLGAAVAAVAVSGARRRALLLVLAAPFAILALLALVDLLSGANAHLTRSVLDAGGLDGLADVAERRLRLSARSFARPVLLAFLPVVALVAALAVARRDRLRAWLAGVPALRAGLLGALAATLVGTLANDSGALLLEVGTAYLLCFTGYAWAEKDAAFVAPGRCPTL